MTRLTRPITVFLLVCLLVFTLLVASQKAQQRQSPIRKTADTETVPTDFPVFPGAVQRSPTEWTTTAQVLAVNDWYLLTLSNRGWTISHMSMNDMPVTKLEPLSFTATKRDKIVAVILTPDTNSSQTTIAVQVSSQPFTPDINSTPATQNSPSTDESHYFVE